MGMADIAEVLWTQYLKHNPNNPNWADKTDFTSNGHGSMLIYSLLHLTGYDLSIDDIKDFRNYIAKHLATPNTVTRRGNHYGSSWKGLANAVGMAVAEKLMAARFNKGDHTSSITEPAFRRRWLPYGRDQSRGLLGRNARFG